MENLEALKKALDDLRVRKNDLLRRVTVAEDQQLMRLEEVQRWISLVEEVETETYELMLRNSREINRLCLCGCCSKL
ncbi:hypothetical protein PanWU01x14_142890 [Parasponia andersonii]|uniref:Uncharacterized protein n=1 Tax=Parasponia andersonii TaxID=3476 RepID=A0A2P5CLE9_PARAD|nr:hypothetical protein PanWU01x14_142890 [Parasponia andersonii]